MMQLYRDPCSVFKEIGCCLWKWATSHNCYMHTCTCVSRATSAVLNFWAKSQISFKQKTNGVHSEISWCCEGLFSKLYEVLFKLTLPRPDLGEIWPIARGLDHLLFYGARRLEWTKSKSNVVASAHVTEHVDDSKTQPKILQLRKDTVSYCFLILKTVTI